MIVPANAPRRMPMRDTTFEQIGILAKVSDDGIEPAHATTKQIQKSLKELWMEI